MSSYFMLFEQERQQHQHPPIMHDPPHINVPICEAFVVAWVERHVFGHHQGQVGGCGAADGVWVEASGIINCTVSAKSVFDEFSYSIFCVMSYIHMRLFQPFSSYNKKLRIMIIIKAYLFQ